MREPVRCTGSLFLIVSKKRALPKQRSFCVYILPYFSIRVS